MGLATGFYGGRSPKYIRQDSDFGDEKKLYWLFAWTSYDAQGGMLDFAGVFHTVGSAINAFDDSEYNDGHIVTIKDDVYTVVAHYYERWEKGKVYYGWERPKLDANGAPQLSGG